MNSETISSNLDPLREAAEQFLAGLQEVMASLREAGKQYVECLSRRIHMRNVYRDVNLMLDDVFGDVQYITLTDLSRKTGIGIKTLRKELKEDRVPYIIMGGTRFFSRIDIRRWIAQKVVDDE